jgi:hypothetical protein
MERVREKASGGAGPKGKWSGTALHALEGVLDPGDSVKRRKAADRIYRDMVRERIGSERAVVELKALTQRQKGGWLVKGIGAAQRRLWRGLALLARSLKR